MVTLAVVSGATDAIGLLALGGAFTSVMTGNMVLLGVSISSADGALAASSGFAILAFCAGAALGVRLAGNPQKGDRVWPRAVTVGTGGGARVRGRLRRRVVDHRRLPRHRPPPCRCCCARRSRSASRAARCSVSASSGMSTTYLTGTLTTVVIRLASGRSVREVWHSVEILLGLVVGAALGTGLILLAPLVAPALQLVALGGVVLIGALAGRRM